MTVKAKNIPVIQFPVKDLEKSIAWYRDVLGLGFTFDFNPEENAAWMNVDEGIGFGLICTDNVPNLDFYNMEGDINPILTFQVDDIHNVREKLIAKGIEVGEMIYKEGGGYSFTFRDPDGHISYLWGGWPE